MNKCPKVIKIEVTEQDRIEAKPFVDNCGCIIATALRRSGYPVFSVTCQGATLEQRRKLIDYKGQLNPKDVGWSSMRQEWLPEAVGRTHILTRTSK